MKAGLMIAMVLTGLSALPASAQTPARPVTISADDLPLTPRFATLLTGYRNCVLKQIDQAPLGSQQDMAAQAMSACALSRGELQSQLISDVRSAYPKAASAAAAKAAEHGIDQLDPMIEQAAVAQAHARYARNMH